MLDSLLERSSKLVILDRIVKEDNSDIILVNQKEEVLEEVRSHFNEQFQKRRTKGKEMAKKWKEIYSPSQNINEDIYAGLNEEVSEEEWVEALRKTKPKSAPGLSGINYPLIKKVGPIAQKVF